MSGIAIVGMAGRFPAAGDTDALWRMLVAGGSGLITLDEAALDAAGVPAALRRDPLYVQRGGFLDDPARFDAGLFGYPPAEAERLDPQQRIMLECGWTALENAGYRGDRSLRVGVYASAAASPHLHRLLAQARATASVEGIEALLAGDKDFVATRLAYELDLEGPAVMIQTACSSSLVAVHFACQGLIGGDCDMALAGGATIRALNRTGYLASPGFIFSPEGVCRPFDAGGTGSVPADGVALVVLRRLEDAIAAGDTIHAVILASAINNDGGSRAGFTAPSVAGQASVIATALDLAGVSPASIGYVEAHGSGTALGDQIELAALADVFSGERAAPLPIGSIKANVGHLDAASGVTGLIKATLAVGGGCIPPCPGHRSWAGDAADEARRFVVPQQAMAWPPGSGPRRACVSSFGLGGTNAHVVIEAPPELGHTLSENGPQLLLWSARTPTAAAALGGQLADHIEDHAAFDLADVADTLMVGRAMLPCRGFVVASDRAQAAAAMRAALIHSTPRQAPTLALLFAGVGDSLNGASAALRARDPAAWEEIDAALDRLADADATAVCAELERPWVRPSLRAPAGTAMSTAPAIAQTALFAFETALARHWIALGAMPAMLLGHSLGEIVAAVIAGVMRLDEAMAMVMARGRLIEALVPGTMIAVAAPAEKLTPLLPDGLWIAAANSRHAATVAGSNEMLAELADRLAAAGIAFRPVAAARALHTPLAAPAAGRLLPILAGMRLAAPAIPIVSARDGTMLTAAMARDPSYWAGQLTAPVAFATALDSLDVELVLEIGAGETVSSFARTAAEGVSREAIASFTPWNGELPEAQLLAATGRLWAAGAGLDARRLAPARVRRVPLPTYPFECYAPAATAPPPPENAAEGALGEVEAILADIWQEALRCTNVGPGDDFRALGGDSLIVLRIAEAVRRVFEINIRVADIWASPTLRDQAKLILEAMVGTGEAPGSADLVEESIAPSMSEPRLLAEQTTKLDLYARAAMRDGLALMGDDTRDTPLLAHWRATLDSRAAGTAPRAELLAALRDQMKGGPYALLVEALARFDAALPDLVAGRRSGLELMLDRPDRPLAERLYETLPESAAALGGLQELLAWVMANSNLDMLDCLEIGGGFGVATRAALAILGDHARRYLFTDVSRFFLDRTRPAHARFQTALFDIDHAPPPAIGVEQFDLVIAGNALHCARHVRDALSHVRACLRPRGRLLLLEATEPADWHLVTMGLMEGYFAFADDRVGSPLLSRPAWRARLDEAGFAIESTWPGPDGSAIGQHVILARRRT